MSVEENQISEDARTAARYGMIRNALREAILDGRLRPGLVLVEAPLSQLFGTSRVPVRQALTLLYEEGLICRFSGRGYLVNPQAIELIPLRLPLTRQVLGLESTEELIDTRPLAERVFDEIAATVSDVVLFGHYRLDEQQAADYLGISRNVVREALMRLRDRGLVEKEPYAQWLAGPLTAQAIVEDYELRALLEPEALRQNASAIPRDTLAIMHQRIIQAQNEHGPALRQLIERVEYDLHVDCLIGLRNQKMAVLIQQSQSALNVSRIFRQTLYVEADDTMLLEHRLIIEALLQDRVDSAALNLRNHLLRARERTLQRLKVLSVLPEPDLPPYMERLS
ncbi:DNA-binding GntR family transcriptional regulator [Pseudomonas duriflava]|uniref:DNA-binding GntR family transcriptional regulator n=1 Tax=Pseudomonas duriflava TaxID=459528 RepID=A0A562PRM5_9PSED|nr:GntR family transcriptional regulator [Pseudomonas duriflava]TWI47059.1 DNA-binding GntR family transcriptional regulator [Pseudomonas duriflava]